MKGEKMETIAPGLPGNPSKTLPAKIERVDMGKVAIYRNEAAMINNRPSWEVSLEFFGQKIDGRWSLSSLSPRVWTVLKETVKLSEEFSSKLTMDGQITGFTRTKEGLFVEGTALSFGVWNGMYWSPEVIRNSPLNEFDGLVIDVEHDRSKASGMVIEKELRGTDIWIKGLITDYETIARIESGELKGFSVDAMVMGDPRRRTVTQVRQYKRLTVCANPACRVCYFGSGNGSNTCA
jgi:hypothetical protein